MNITAICPRCQRVYQVDEGLRGKRMRCPNPLCRTAFEVQVEGEKPVVEALKPTEPAPLDKPAPAVSGTVSDFVQVLPAELAEPAPAVVEKLPEPPRTEKPVSPPKTPAKKPRPPIVVEPPASTPPTPVAEPSVQAPAAPGWQNVPPPIRSTTATVAPITAPVDFLADFPDDDVATSDPSTANGSLEVGPGTWEAPPVRGVAIDSAAPSEAPSLEPPPFVPPIGEAPPQTARWRPMLVIAVMAILLVGTAGVAWWVVEGARAGSEADRFKRAEELYVQQDFAEAREVLQKLVADFPGSPDARRYRFLAELSGVSAEAYDARDIGELKPALDHTIQFSGFNQNDPLLEKRQPDVWKTLRRLAEQLAGLSEKQHDSDALKWARQAWTEAAKYKPPDNVNGPEIHAKLTKEFDRVQQVLDVFTRRQAVLDLLRQHVAQASALAVRDSRSLATATGLKDDPEVVSLLAEVVTAHRASVVYVPAGADAIAEVSDDDLLPGLLVVPALTKAKAGHAPARVALALARGVLYALDRDGGSVRWARRVGIDTAVLPLRVAADPITPELVLVLSSDSKSVSALVADNGTVVWRSGLEAPCTGQPLLIGRSLLVPTLAGTVDEIEIVGGRRLGQYRLGQRLAVGGARQEGTSLVYFPGDEFCVYVLDTSTRKCEAVLYSNHPSGSLRGVPILVSQKAAVSSEASAKGSAAWMLLCQAHGTAAVEVRPFELPIRDPDQPAGTPTLRVPGLSWFAPWHDAEKLALATDAGRLSLFGIRQPGNRNDLLLFPLLKEPYSIAGGIGSARAQVVHADANGYWVLMGGRLQRLDAVLRPGSGPDLVPAGPESLELGSPLHATQQFPLANGQTELVLTTLAQGRPSCICTAIDAASGNVYWQRQLGCVPMHPVNVLDSHLLLRDATGLLLLDPTRFLDKPGGTWQTVGEFAVQEPLGPTDRVAILNGVGEFVQLVWSSAPGAATLRIRHIPINGPSTTEPRKLPATIAGTPALGDGFVLLPLADGVAVRLDLGAGGTVAAGPNWRVPGVDEQSPGHIVALGGAEFLLTDGGRGVSRVSWPSAKVHERRAKAELSHRIVAPPAVLRAGADAAPRVCVADADNALTLLDGDNLKVLKGWRLPGKITAGPFVRGTMILCVVDKKQLVWIDPERDELRQSAMVADIVGAPLLVDGMLVVADVSGRFQAFDPQTGNAVGYTLKANVAPDAAPVAFGPGRLLVPLNDGTLLLLPLAKLRGD